MRLTDDLPRWLIYVDVDLWPQTQIFSTQLCGMCKEDMAIGNQWAVKERGFYEHATCAKRIMELIRAQLKQATRTEKGTEARFMLACKDGLVPGVSHNPRGPKSGRMTWEERTDA